MFIVLLSLLLITLFSSSQIYLQSFLLHIKHNRKKRKRKEEKKKLISISTTIISFHTITIHKLIEHLKKERKKKTIKEIKGVEIGYSKKEMEENRESFLLKYREGRNSFLKVNHSPDIIIF